VVAAAGPGDGRAAHASWQTAAGGSTTVQLFQQGICRYNLWTGAGAGDDWTLEVFSQNGLAARYTARDIPENFWNGRRQLTFSIEGNGVFHLRVKRHSAEPAAEAIRFDCWTLTSESSAFHNYIDPVLIAEPAAFPQVISAGLTAGIYSPHQGIPGEKPDVLLDGPGPISFRLPEVTAAVDGCCRCAYREGPGS
jgi:hypothetical protein